jgi:DNA polymerase
MPPDPSDLTEHLRFFAELGAEGFSRDPAWRGRARAASAAADAPEATAPPDVPGQGAARAVRDAQSSLAAHTAVTGAAEVTLSLPGSAAEALATVRADLGECTRCKLHEGRTHLVFGVGHPEARLMFVGEGPGADEDEQGIPFVGRAGQLLTQIVKAMGYERDEVYIANVVKCRPPGNRNPEPDEIERCEPFLMRQIDVIKPEVIVALGKFAAQTLLRTAEPISRLRGRFHPLGAAQLMPTFHPSYLLRNPSAKREVWDDMKQVMAVLRRDAQK